MMSYYDEIPYPKGYFDGQVHDDVFAGACVECEKILFAGEEAYKFGNCDYGEYYCTECVELDADKKKYNKIEICEDCGREFDADNVEIEGYKIDDGFYCDDCAFNRKIVLNEYEE